MDGGQGAVVAGVHGLEHVQGLGPSYLADDDAVGALAQGVDHQVANGDLALSFFVRRAGLHAHHVGLAQAQFGHILHGHDAFIFGDEP